MCSHCVNTLYTLIQYHPTCADSKQFYSACQKYLSSNSLINLIVRNNRQPVIPDAEAETRGVSAPDVRPKALRKCLHKIVKILYPILD